MNQALNPIRKWLVTPITFVPPLHVLSGQLLLWLEQSQLDKTDNYFSALVTCLVHVSEL